MADRPDARNPGLQAYLGLDAKLEALRQRPRGEATAEESAILAQMESMWSHLSRPEREWLEYRSLRRSAARRGGDNVERKLAALWPNSQQRERAQLELSRYGEGPDEHEIERVRLAVLRVSEGRLERLAELVTTVKEDPSAVLAVAEHPHETAAAWARRPNLGEDEETRLAELRTEDMRAYWEWVTE